MTSSSPHHGRDPGVTLIRISPARIQTQVTQTVRYRPVRSLLLLGLLVVISLFVLFTLSQMAVVQHTMMAQLETGRPGGGGWAPGNQGRASRPAQKPWRSQFNQFKIEPLLIRNAPSVEVNTAMAANRRRATQVAAIILQTSLLVKQSPYYSNFSIQPTTEIHHQTHHFSQTKGQHFSSSTQTSHTHHRLSSSPANITTHNPQDRQPHSNSSQSSHIALIPDNKNNSTSSPKQSSPDAPSLAHVVPHFTRKVEGNTSLPLRGNASDRDAKYTSKESDGEHNKRKEGRERLENKWGNTGEGEEKIGGEEAPRKRFFDRLECALPEGDCDTQHLVDLSTGMTLAPSESFSTQNQRDHAIERGSASSIGKDDSPAGHRENDNQHPTEDNTSTEEPPLPTEFGESEKDFEPLYLREDEEDFDLPGEKTTDSSPSAPPAATRKTLTDEELRSLPMCPEIPPGLKGHLDIDLDCLEELRLSEVLKDLEWVLPGGKWSPVYEPTNPCLPRHKVAVVLPYRDRLHHLIILLSWLHPILRRQQLEYTIYVAEQAGNATFNKGTIMNAGFMEAWQRSDANCFVFHDVDLLPEDDRNMYSCPPQPRHLSVGVDTLGYKLPYFLLVGGVLSVRGDHFLRLNGYSNMYWGWGGEDDDMGYRIKQSGLSITRPPNLLARYTMIRHLKRRPLTWKVRGKLVRTSGRRYRLDGLNTLKYTLLALHKHPLFTHLLLDVGTPPENLVRLDAH